MEIILPVYFFIFGLVLGSFFNVIGLRVPLHEGFTNGRSHCPACRHMLAWHELIPVFSYVLQGGKCRHCKLKIAPLYPVVEVSTGVLFAIAYTHIGLDRELAVALFLVSMLMIILVSDLNYMLIPDKVLLFFLPLFIFGRIISPLDPWWAPAAGGALAFILIALIILASRGGMGAGDMKLFGVLGIVLGPQEVLLVFFLACLTGAVFGGLQMLLRKVKSGQPVPFGPYIVLAALTVYFFADPIMDWYFILF
jgi:leader peptidase (prepilin peptidase)/N-methyltransferase